MGIAMTVAVIGGVAYAAFSDTASVEGVSFSAGDATLSVWDGDSYEQTFTSGWNFSGMYPGYTNSTQTFWLKNESTSPVTFDITGTLRSGVTGDWTELSPNVEVAIIPVSDTDPAGDYHTLAAWNSPGGHSILPQLAAGAEQQYRVYVNVPVSAGSEIEGKSLSGVNFDFTGTQDITP